MTNRRIGLRTYKKVDRRGVSEVIGTILLLSMTVMVFSGIILFVNTLTGPGDQTYVNLVPSLERTNPNNGVVFITHAGGQPLEASRTSVIIQVNSSNFPLAVEDGLVPVDGRWVTGQRWAVPFTGNQLSQNATVQVMVVDGRTNQVVLFAVVQRGVGIGGAFPIIGNAVIIPDGYVYNTGNHLFRVRVVAVDYDNDLPNNGVNVELSALGCGLADQTLANTGFGVFESTSWANITTCLPAGTYFANVTATDLAGHATKGRVRIEVRSQTVVGPVSTGSGPFGWSFSNRFQAFEIYEATEWDTQRFNGTPTRDFVKGETVVVVVASQFLKNIDLQNELMLYSPIGLPIKAQVYGGGSPSTSTRPSSTAAFTFDEFIAGYFLYTARFNTNSAAYGFNGSQLAAGSYNLEITLRTSNLPPPDNRFATATQINVTDTAGGPLPNYPRLQFYHDKALTDPSNTFNFTELVFVKITVATATDDAVFGAVTIGDYQGHIQIFAPTGNPPVSDYTVKNATTYTFSIDLSSPNRDLWIYETNAYGFTLSQLIDADEKYALSGQLIITGPKWGADVVSAMREWRNFRNDRVYSLMYENDNAGNWPENNVASISSSTRRDPRWAGRDMLDVMLADMDGDGSLDAVEGSASGFVLLFRNLDGVGHNWDSALIDTFNGPDVLSVAAGRIDADQFNDVVAGTDNGQVWWYKNDGSWVPLICDRVSGRRNCEPVASEDSAPKLIANYGSGVRVEDLKLADMNKDGTNDLVASFSNNYIRIYYNDGFGHFGLQNSNDYNFTAETAVQGTVTGSYAATQSSNNAYENIREVSGTGQSTTSYSPQSEVMSLYGQVETGSYANTLALDGAPYEVLAETFYNPGGGRWLIRNSSSGSAPGHQYYFGNIPSLGGSDFATVTISAFVSTGTEPMEVRYKVGTSGSVSSLLGTFSETSITTKTFALTGFTGGHLYIVIQDSDYTAGDDDSALQGDLKQTKVSLDLVRVDVVESSGTTSRLEHKWQSATIPSGGDAYRFFLEANHTFNNESDDMVFEWSTTTNGPWSPMLTVTKAGDDNGLQNSVLPSSVGGTQIWIRATDTNRSANGTFLDTLSVDHMFVRRYYTIPLITNVSTGAAMKEVVVGDMNNDTNNDVVGVRSAGGVIFYGPAYNTSTSLPTPATAYGIDIGYINGDDKLDVVIGENDQFVHVFTNDGSWTRTQFADLSVIRNTRTNYVRIGDIDGDGFDDVMLATNDGDVLYYRHLQGTGWSLEIVDNLTRRINTIDIGDVDRGVIFDKSGKLQ